MALPNLKGCVYSAVGGSEIEILEAKLNIMETISLVLQIISDLNDNVHKGQYMYRTLLDKHFNSAMEVMLTFIFIMYNQAHVWTKKARLYNNTALSLATLFFVLEGCIATIHVEPSHPGILIRATH